MAEDIGEPDISDPEVYWPMVTYAMRVNLVLVSLRHLYVPHEALLWIASPQSLLDQQAPAMLLASPEGADKVHALIARINDSAYS